MKSLEWINIRKVGLLHCLFEGVVHASGRIGNADHWSLNAVVHKSSSELMAKSCDTRYFLKCSNVVLPLGIKSQSVLKRRTRSRLNSKCTKRTRFLSAIKVLPKTNNLMSKITSMSHIILILSVFRALLEVPQRSVAWLPQPWRKQFLTFET